MDLLTGQLSSQGRLHSPSPWDWGCAFLRGSCDRKCNRLGYPSDVRDCHQRAHAGAAEPPGRTLSRAPWPLIETASFISPKFHTDCNLWEHKFTKLRLWRAGRHGFLSPSRFQHDRFPRSGNSGSRGHSPTLGVWTQTIGAPQSGHRTASTAGRVCRSAIIVQGDGAV